jgi:hypothetical protein
LELSFTSPRLATDGEELTKPLEVEIFREIASPGAGRSQSSSPASNDAFSASPLRSPWVSLVAADLKRLARGPKVAYVDAASPEYLTPLGSTFGYQVRALTRGFRGRAILGEPSNLAVATLLDVSGPVQNLRAVPTKKAISLSWDAPARTLSGAPPGHLSGYEVYRSIEPKPESFSIIGESKEPVFLDPHFEFGQTYHYKVRAVFKQGTQEAEGEDGQPRAVTPEDIFRPASPQGLTALYTVGAVELIWNASLEPDLAGYNIYRREEAKPYQRINKDLAATTIYRDSAIEPHHDYFYQVTAVDLSGNESTPSTETRAATD